MSSNLSEWVALPKCLRQRFRDDVRLDKPSMRCRELALAKSYIPCHSFPARVIGRSRAAGGLALRPRGSCEGWLALMSATSVGAAGASRSLVAARLPLARRLGPPLRGGAARRLGLDGLHELGERSWLGLGSGGVMGRRVNARPAPQDGRQRTSLSGRCTSPALRAAL
jgi:hypothetical protein